MKYLFAYLFAFALLATTAIAQSTAEINTAVGLVQPSGFPQVEPPIASISRGLVDKNGKVILNAVDGSLKLYNATNAYTYTITLPVPSANRTLALPIGGGTVVTTPTTLSWQFTGATYNTTLVATEPTVASTSLTVPDPAGVAATFSLASTATLTAGATPAFAPKASISTYLLTPGEDETIAGTTTGAVAGKVYYIRVLTSGATSRTITFGSNFKSTGTLATGVTTAKTFVLAFLYDGTNFCEVSRTTAM